MAKKADFTEQEWESLQKGVVGAGLLVSLSDRSFFDTFKEAGALGKHVAQASRRLPTSWSPTGSSSWKSRSRWPTRPAAATRRRAVRSRRSGLQSGSAASYAPMSSAAVSARSGTPVSKRLARPSSAVSSPRTYRP